MRQSESPGYAPSFLMMMGTLQCQYERYARKRYALQGVPQQRHSGAAPSGTSLRALLLFATMRPSSKKNKISHFQPALVAPSPLNFPDDFSQHSDSLQKLHSAPVQRDVPLQHSSFTFLDRDQFISSNNIMMTMTSGVVTPLPSPMSLTQRPPARRSRYTGYNSCQLSGNTSQSEGYSTCSSNRSWASSESPSVPRFVDITTCTQLVDGGGGSDRGISSSPVDDPLSLPLPPAEYSDDAPELTSLPNDLSLTQRSSGAVSDFFSQSGNSSDSNSQCDGFLQQDDCRQDDMLGCATGFLVCPPSTASPSVIEEDDHNLSLESCVASSVSSIHSPIAKRGRFGSCRSEEYKPDDTKTDSGQNILDFERYCNEYAPDTYFWLCHQEATTHALGISFMAAQKLGGASEGDRRTALMRAIVDMRKLKHTVESIHLGAYIMDKCLDSFHIASGALVDVCAVSMVLGTKMEEYDSLRPGTVDGLAGATRDKARLCHIEKRIIHELNNGLCFPTPLVFANYMLVYVHSDEEQIRFAHYLLELALLESRFRDEGGTRVAHAAVCVSSAMVKKKDSIFASECQALLDTERQLFHLTKYPIGSTRDVMRELVIEMGKAVEEKHSILIDYLAEDNKRVCFCEISPALWNLICGAHINLYESPALELVV
ncbi:hypothetical protein Y032_0070g460 [Ancylostoma ceylanicum]|uniref:Cyclin C-terminal domain-containing protein n=2 Tax=Ancylostoma ceylanicum TaxID=53326 RepID=A0A016TY18_9BILA|nr:hypothetical protein Y032_0070g460 [Ancylostoma ceylanicum]